MLTRRGFWLLFGALAAFVPATLTAQLEGVVLPLGVLLWFGFQWALHVVRAAFVVRQLRVEHSVNGQHKARHVRWAQRTLRIEFTIHNPSAISLPHIELRDFVPAAAEVVDGSANHLIELPARSQSSISYQMRFPQPGVFYLEGLHVEIAEPHGFFKSAWFVSARVELAVLPGPALIPGTLQTRTKDDRRLGQGVHRLRAAGSSCELLEVRPYRPGDAPRSIAWKISARRDQLMTRDYEAEVPIRLTLVLDAGRSMRFGPPARTPLILAVNALSSVAYRSMAARDPVGLLIIEDDRVQSLPPGVGARHLTRIQTALAKAASLSIGPTSIPADQLQDEVVRTAAEYRPHWLRAGVNRPDAWWRSVRVFSVRGVLASFVLPVLAGVLFMGRFLYVFLLVVTTVLFLIFGPKPGSGRARKKARKLASHVLALEMGLGAATTARLTKRDDEFSVAAQWFLERWQRPPTPRLTDRSGQLLLDDSDKATHMAKCLRALVAHARERQAMALVVDLVESADRLQPLIDSLKLATARGHQIVLLYSWPAWLDAASHPADDARAADAVAAALDGAMAIAGRDRLRAECKRLGVQCLPFSGNEHPAAILRRIERVRRALGNRSTVAN